MKPRYDQCNLLEKKLPENFIHTNLYIVTNRTVCFGEYDCGYEL